MLSLRNMGSGLNIIPEVSDAPTDLCVRVQESVSQIIALYPAWSSFTSTIQHSLLLIHIAANFVDLDWEAGLGKVKVLLSLFGSTCRAHNDRGYQKRDGCWHKMTPLFDEPKLQILDSATKGALVLLERAGQSLDNSYDNNTLHFDLASILTESGISHLQSKYQFYLRKAVRQAQDVNDSS